MTDTSLTEAVDSWTAQAVMASGYLARLYRGLGDERQADLAAQACGSCGERAQRLGLVARIAALDTTFTLEHPEETIGEEKAWQLLVGAHAGLHAFLGLVDGDEQGRATGASKAFHEALRGYRTAFPEEMTIPGIRKAIDAAARHSAEAFPCSAGAGTAEEKSGLPGRLFEELLKETGECRFV